MADKQNFYYGNTTNDVVFNMKDTFTGRAEKHCFLFDNFRIQSDELPI